jgi:hypothetical protein
MNIIVQTNTGPVPLTNVFTAFADEYLDNGKQIGFQASGIPTWNSGYLGKLLFESINQNLYLGISGAWRLIPDSSSIWSSGSIATAISNASGAAVITASGIAVYLDNNLSGYFINHIASVSGAAVITASGGAVSVSTINLYNASGVLNNKIDNVSGALKAQIWASGSIVTAIANASGSAVISSSGIALELDNILSGHLMNEMNNLSGSLAYDIYYVSGYMLDNVRVDFAYADYLMSGVLSDEYKFADDILSGYLKQDYESKLDYASGYITNNYIAADDLLSGYLLGEIFTTSGALQFSIDSISGAFINKDGSVPLDNDWEAAKVISCGGMYSSGNVGINVVNATEALTVSSGIYSSIYSPKGFMIGDLGDGDETYKTKADYDATIETSLGNITSINAGDVQLSSFWGADVVLDNGGYAYNESSATQARIPGKTAFNISRKIAPSSVLPLFTVLGRNGNVGIETKTPQEKLDVSGNIAASGLILGPEGGYKWRLKPSGKFLHIECLSGVAWLPAGYFGV